MASQFRAIGNTCAAPTGRIPLEDDARLARAACDELFLVGMPRVNVLLVGTDTVLRRVLETMLGHVRTPIVGWSPGAQTALPPVDQHGTLVLYDVCALGLREQIQLLEWSESAMRHTQVISLASAPLLPRVRAGSFIDTLYYRLNTVYMELTGLNRAA